MGIHCSHTELKDPGGLIPHPKNPNTHPQAQIELLARIIKHQGWRNPIVVSQRSGFIIAGHARLKAAQLLELDEVPVDYQDFETEADEWAHLAADNKLAELAEPDQAILAELLQDLKAEGFDTILAGFDENALSELLGGLDEGDADAEAQTDKADELRDKWDVKPGQVWSLGGHRLMCGDSTDQDTVARLLDGDKPHLMVTDPPYGVEYDANWRNEALRKDGTPIGGRAIGKVSNDEKADWSDAWQLFPGDVAYVWSAPGALQVTSYAALINVDFEIRAQIIWNKSNFAIGRGDYHKKHEPCWYAVRKGKKGHWQGDRTQSTVWDIPKPQKSETGHSTQKPIECMARPIRNNSKQGDLVYEPFSGSGTTIIACENLRRQCRAIELEPGYVAIAVQRWADATGGEPKLVK